MNVKKIILSVDFPETSFRVIHQAAAVARHFQAEIVMMHIVTPLSRAAGVPADAAANTSWNMVAEITKGAQKNLDQSLGPELAGLRIKPLLATGDATTALLEVATQENADLIMMASSGYAFDQFLVGSVTPNALHAIDCPVWTDGSVEKPSTQKFAIRNILCAVDFKPHRRGLVSMAEQIATEFGARLTLAHVTAGVEFWGPGGSYVNQGWKEALDRDASRHIEELQQGLRTRAGVFIGNGDVPQVLRQAVQQTNADLLVTGCYPYGGYLRTHGYGIIRAVPVPVLSV